MFHLFSVLKTGVCLPQRSAMQPVKKPGLIEVAERPQRKRWDSRYTEVIPLFKHHVHIHAETEQNSHTDTPSIVFRHLPPRKTVVNQCLEFALAVVTTSRYLSLTAT